MKYTRNLHVRAVVAYSLEINCSAVGVYISPQIRILHTKNFFANQLKGKPKFPVIFKGTAVSAITLHMPCVFDTTGSHVCLWVERSHI